jgi:hypothetical protein
MMASCSAHAATGSQDQIVLVGRGPPLVEKLTSEVQCGKATYRVSWRNRATEASDAFAFEIDGRPVRHKGTRAVEGFLSGARVVRLATVTCERGHEMIEVALTGLRLRPKPGEKDDLTGFFRLGPSD